MPSSLPGPGPVFRHREHRRPLRRHHVDRVHQVVVLGPLELHQLGGRRVQRQPALAPQPLQRDLEDLAADIAPYRALHLDAVMPAHVIYPRIDPRPAGFSPVWIDMLRHELAFDGVVFSDDLSMEGASVAGGIIARAEAAWQAGCDMLLVCNAPDAVAELLASWQPVADPIRAARIGRLLPSAGQAAPAAGDRSQAGRLAVARQGDQAGQPA